MKHPGARGKPGTRRIPRSALDLLSVMAQAANPNRGRLVDATHGVTRGAGGLDRLLREEDHDLRAVGPDGFRPWLDRHLFRWGRDPVFRQRAAIRDLRRAYPDLRRLEADHRRAARANAESPAFARLSALEREAENARRAVAGLTRALDAASPERQPGLAAKLDAFRQAARAAAIEHAALTQASPERQALIAARVALAQLRETIGLDRAEEQLAALLAGRGRRAGRSGESFEDVAADLARRCIAPDVADGGDVRLLRRVRLGTAGAEFDILVVRVPGEGRPVEVLAAVEAKRDINGLAHGFRRRGADLAWLTGDTGSYDPAAHCTHRFPTGHFDRPAEHREGGETFRFAPESFKWFRRDPAAGEFWDRLYLVTRWGPLWGLSPPALAKVAARVASDEDWHPDDPASEAALFAWCRSLAGPVESPDVLRLFAADPGRARQVLLVTG